jgi:hypothetical protein
VCKKLVPALVAESKKHRPRALRFELLRPAGHDRLHLPWQSLALFHNSDESGVCLLEIAILLIYTPTANMQSQCNDFFSQPTCAQCSSSGEKQSKPLLGSKAAHLRDFHASFDELFVVQCRGRSVKRALTVLGIIELHEERGLVGQGRTSMC